MSKRIHDTDMAELLRKHFWCDFSDIIPRMKWSDGLASPEKECGADKAPHKIPQKEN
jgi:hypothetical protein